MEYKIPIFQRNQPLWGIILSVSMVAAYLVLFFIFSPHIGGGVAAFSIIPILTIAWFFGLRGAAIGSVLVVSLDSALFYFFRQETFANDMAHGGAMGLATLVAVAFSVGWSRNLFNRAKNELVERKKVEAVLRESEHRSRLIFENMAQGLAIDRLIYAQDGAVVDWVVLNINRAYEKIMRLARDEVVGRWGSELYVNYRDMLPLFQQVADQAKQRTGAGDSGLAHKALRIRDRELKITASWVADDQVSVLFTDVSEELRMIEAERAQRHLAEALRDIAGAITSTLELEDVLDRIIIHIRKITSYDAINIMLIEHGRVRPARHQGYTERGLTDYIESFDRTVDEVPGMKWIKDNARALVFPDTHKSDSWLVFPPTAWIRSFAGLPISRRGEIIGFLNLNSATPNYFQPEFIDQLQPFADQAALAIENARAYQNIQQNARRMAVLNRASSMLNRPVEYRTILQVTVNCFNDAYDLDEVILALFDDTRQRLSVVACRASVMGNMIVGDDIILANNPAAAYVVANKRHLLMQHGNLDENPDVREQMENEHISALLLLPLLLGDDLIGMVNCNIKRRKGFFSEEDLDVASSIANLAATRIEQARIYEEERKQVSSLALLHATSLDISRSHNNPDLLKTIVRRAAGLLNATGGTLYLCNSQRSELLCQVSHNFSHNEEGSVCQYGEGAAGQVAETGLPLVVDDYLNWEHRSLDLTNVGSSFALLTVPVVYQGAVTGVLQVFRNDLHNPFTAQDTELLNLFSSQVAISLENARLYEEIQQVAIRDSLTGLYNRRGMVDIAEREISRALRYQRPLSVCLLDIDHFKKVNDTYGHMVGDEVLQKLANKIRQNLRSIDIVGRYGGEEFVILAVENDQEAACGLGERLCRLISAKPFKTSAGGVAVTVSIGVVGLSEKIRDLPALLQSADQALYHAKNSGRNQVKQFAGSKINA